MPPTMGHCRRRRPILADLLTMFVNFSQCWLFLADINLRPMLVSAKMFFLRRWGRRGLRTRATPTKHLTCAAGAAPLVAGPKSKCMASIQYSFGHKVHCLRSRGAGNQTNVRQRRQKHNKTAAKCEKCLPWPPLLWPYLWDPTVVRLELYKPIGWSALFYRV